MVTDRAFAGDDGLPTTVHPSAPPMTGSLTLFQQEGVKPLARLLLSLPGGVRFQRLGLTLISEEDLSLTTALVVKCSQTLKSLWVSYQLPGTSIRHCVLANDSTLL